MMMGVGILVLLLLIIGIGSALKALDHFQQSNRVWRSIDLAGNATDQANGVQPAPETPAAENTQQDVRCHQSLYADSRANPGGNGWSTTC